eukprot:CAMPEP_0117501358 /NCGR_PEP_ID=MMETSP0784-20121206/23257_1 /TAXON_ID=39447 /ORGANISM="" /LENGTH=536 /DNA_ID=CAMNT_0005296609 /DNA_START=120 /DNA_END=1726 /DNA_ORIENTATION=+
MIEASVAADGNEHVKRKAKRKRRTCATSETEPEQKAATQKSERKKAKSKGKSGKSRGKTKAKSTDRTKNKKEKTTDKTKDKGKDKAKDKKRRRRKETSDEPESSSVSSDSDSSEEDSDETTLAYGVLVDPAKQQMAMAHMVQQWQAHAQYQQHVQHWQHWQHWHYQQQQHQQHQQQQMAAKQQEEEKRRREDEEKRKQREEADRKQREEEKKRLEEQKKNEAEENRRQVEELRKKAEEARKAAAELTTALQKMRVASPETYDALAEELDEVFARELGNCGPQMQVFMNERAKVLEIAKKSVEMIKQFRNRVQGKPLDPLPAKSAGLSVPMPSMSLAALVAPLLSSLSLGAPSLGALTLGAPFVPRVPAPAVPLVPHAPRGPGVDRGVAAIMRVIPRLRLATPETFEALVKELDEVYARELDNCGGQRQYMIEERERAMSQAMRCVDNILQLRSARQLEAAPFTKSPAMAQAPVDMGKATAPAMFKDPSKVVAQTPDMYPPLNSMEIALRITSEVPPPQPQEAAPQRTSVAASTTAS